MKKMILFFAAALITNLTVNAQDHKSSFSDVYDVYTQAALNVISSDGDIAVVAHNKNTIEVHYSVSKKGKMITGTKEEVLNLIASQITIKATQSGNRVDVEVKEKIGSGFSNWKESYGVDVKVMVPSDTRCNIVTDDGDLALKGLGPNQKCKTSDGDIAARDLDGDLDAITSDGDIILRDIKGDVTAVTSDGDIIAKNVNGELDGRTSDGEIIRR